MSILITHSKRYDTYGNRQLLSDSAQLHGLMHAEKQANLEALGRHVERLARRVQRLDRLSRQYGWTRLGIVLAGAVAAFVAFQAGGAVWGWGVVVVGVAAFGITAHCHRRVEGSIRRHRLWRRIKAAHIARMTLDWPALPTGGSFAPDPAHPFERDLDLTGPRSLHHLLDTAVSRGGSQRLWTWLRQPLFDPEGTRMRG